MSAEAPGGAVHRQAAGVPATGHLECRGVTVTYGTSPVIAGLDLDVPAGTSLALLGPSGSGKTTLLHAIAGFVDVAAGEISIDGELVAAPGRSVPIERRSVGVVFQGFALWPHMTAVETVAYPYRRRGVPAPEARRRALDLLARLHIDGLAERLPAQLSGGEQQRVGFCRALAREAAVYLFDEPTAHLDTELRAGLQEELANQRGRLGAAAIHATHDVAEAMAVADRVALLRGGRIVQAGRPAEVYERPVDLWAARLTGPASLLACGIAGIDTGPDGSTALLTIGDSRLRVPIDGPESLPGARATEVDGLRALVRPEWVRLVGAPDRELPGELPGVISGVWYRGPHTDYRIETQAGALSTRAAGPPRWQPGDGVTWGLERAWLVRAGGSATG